MLISGKPIEFINGKPLLDLVQKMNPSKKKKKETKSPSSSPKLKRLPSARKRGLTLSKEFPTFKVNSKRSRTTSLKNLKSISPTSSFTPRDSNTNTSVALPFVLPDKSIACDSNFSSFLFSDVFTSLIMRPVFDDKHFLMVAGTFSDLLQYCLLHSNPHFGKFYIFQFIPIF